MAETDADGWIPWEGGECPIEPETMVQVQYRNEPRSQAEKFSPKKAATKKWKWSTAGNGVPSRTDIIAYRIVDGSASSKAREGRGES
jgi:hypothetical protein